MSYTIHHTKKDGSVEYVRKCTGGISNIEKRPTNPVSGRNAKEADRNIRQTLEHTRKNLRDPKGFSEDRNSRLVAQVPREVLNHVIRNEGRDAANDPKYLIRASEKLGYDSRVSRGRF